MIQAERGDFFSFRLHPALLAGALVAAGDTICTAHSNEVARKVAQLKGELAAEMALLNLYGSGQKSSVVEEAAHRLSHANAQAEQQRMQVKRLERLLKKDAVSEEEVEVARSALRLSEIQTQIEKAQLTTVQTGDRAQQIDWVRALLRRAHPSPSQANVSRVALGNLAVDASRREVCLNGVLIGLTTVEFDLLWHLINRAGHVVSRQDIYRALFNYDYDGLDRSVDVYISRIRQKLGDDPSAPHYIKTVRGVGYLLAGEGP